MTIDHKYDEYTVVGVLEWVHARGKDKKVHTAKARIDTGATKSSIDQALVEELGWGPVIAEKAVRSAHGRTVRKIIEGTIEIAGKVITEHFTIADRAHMRYQLLIGRNVLRRGFLIDPTKKLKKVEE